MIAIPANDDFADRDPRRRAVGLWLLCVAAIILCMVTIGGLTRLTGSGLSITEWKPVTGVVPPLSEQAWRDEFAEYKRIPQYVLENRGMSLGDFKAIYWWEWTHRFLGRLLGFVFLFPFIWFVWRGAIGRPDIPRMVVLFALGGLQGFVGWWMVQSGLETRVSVSQYRLAIHLGTAIILLGAILWTALEYLRAPPPRLFRGPTSSQGGGKNVGLSLPPPTRRGRTVEARSDEAVRVGGFLFIALVYIQMLLGALVAGLRGGLIYNTWPSMNGRVLPELDFAWTSFFEDAGLAQFDHRIGAYIVALSAFALWFYTRKTSARRAATAVLHITLLQIVLGIATLLLQAPVVLSALHQLTAALLFCAAIWNAFEARHAASA